MTAIQQPGQIEQPDQILDDLRDAIRRWESARPRTDEERAAAEETTNRLARLDSWLSNGGYLPRAWRSPWPDSARPSHSPRAHTPPQETEEKWEDAEEARERRGCVHGCTRIDEHEGGLLECVIPTVDHEPGDPVPFALKKRTPPGQMRYFSDTLKEYAKIPTSYKTGTKMTGVALALEVLADAMDHGHWIFQPEVSRGRQHETDQIAAPPGVQFKTERRLADVRPGTQYSFTAPDGAYSGTFNSDGSGEFFIEGQDGPVKFTKEELEFSKVLDVEEPMPKGTLQPESPYSLFDTGKHAKWTAPPEDCPYTGWPMIDRADLEICPCGHRHIRVETYGADGSAGSTHANVIPETAQAMAEAAYRVAETWSDLAALLRRAEEDRLGRETPDLDAGRGHPGLTVQAGVILFAISEGLSRANLDYAIGDGQVTVNFDDDAWTIEIGRPGQDRKAGSSRGGRTVELSRIQRFVQSEGWYIHNPCGEQVFEVEDGCRMGNVIRELLKHNCSDGGEVDNT